MNKLHWQTITPNMRAVMKGFAGNKISSEFYLAGGTALALQLGHRLSVDLDFFSPTLNDIPSLIEPLQAALTHFSPVLADSSWGNLVFLANDLRVGFYGYRYELINPWRDAEGIKLASISDIGLMKMDALLARASRKDFYDLYIICQTINLSDLFELPQRKYPAVRDFQGQVAKHMVYFDRADKESSIPMLVRAADWDSVKDWFRNQAKVMGNKWLK